MNAASDLAKHWRLNPEVAFLNHGSFGATPKVVLEEQRRLQDELERDPIHFLGYERTLGKRLDAVRDRITPFIGAEPGDVAFVGSATQGVNAVLRSLPINPSDELIITSHGYNACNNVVRFVAERAGAKVVVADVPFPIRSDDCVLDAIAKVVTDKTTLLLIDHVTSPTAVVLPVRKIVELAHERGVRVLVDGAHAPGMINVDVTTLGADYYTANHHKWLCAPKASGFLYVRSDHQHEVRPISISHAAYGSRMGRPRFLAEFDWGGTYDPTPILALPAALDFLQQLRPGGMAEHLSANHQLALRAREILADKFAVEPPAPADMIGSMVTMPLPESFALQQLNELHRRLFENHRIETPLFEWSQRAWVRVSAQAYNSAQQYEQLAEAIVAECT